LPFSQSCVQLCALCGRSGVCSLGVLWTPAYACHTVFGNGFLRRYYLSLRCYLHSQSASPRASLLESGGDDIELESTCSGLYIVLIRPRPQDTVYASLSLCGAIAARVLNKLGARYSHCYVTGVLFRCRLLLGCLLLGRLFRFVLRRFFRRRCAAFSEVSVGKVCDYS